MDKLKIQFLLDSRHEKRPPEKVFEVGFRGPNIFSGDLWMSRVRKG